MSRQIFRGENGETTHIKILHRTFVTPKDYDIWLDHKISTAEVRTFFGEDDILEEMAKVSNLEYPDKQLRYDIMVYCEVFKDEVRITEY